MSSTTMTTVMGIVMAAGTAVVDFVAHNTMEGGAMKQPTFWLGLIVAAAMGVKGYFTQGIAQPPTPPAK